ncbi:chromate transporter [Synergistaceae bacterium OttesenSCG-928-I11]|nr:chromate transporter [Synergistaceae bacterium OttesenSCG-928-I11]
MDTLLALFVSFFKIGLVGYGGGPSLIPLIKEEVVNVRGWMDALRFVDMVAIGNAIPGPIATKLSLVVGYEVAGFAGIVTATVAIALPGVALVLLLMKCVDRVKDNPRIQSMMKGLRPVVVAILAYAAYDMSYGSLVDLYTWAIAGIAFALMIFTKIHPALLVVAGAIAGVSLGL